MNYETILNNAPQQDSPEFLEYLRTNNRVVWESKLWLVIENCKYNTPEKPWYTAFHKVGKVDYKTLFKRYWNWQWLKRSIDKQTVPDRFHIHFTK